MFKKLFLRSVLFQLPTPPPQGEQESVYYQINVTTGLTHPYNYKPNNIRKKQKNLTWKIKSYLTQNKQLFKVKPPHTYFPMVHIKTANVNPGIPSSVDCHTTKESIEVNTKLLQRDLISKFTVKEVVKTSKNPTTAAK